MYEDGRYWVVINPVVNIPGDAYYGYSPPPGVASVTLHRIVTVTGLAYNFDFILWSMTD